MSVISFLKKQYSTKKKNNEPEDEIINLRAHHLFHLYARLVDNQGNTFGGRLKKYWHNLSGQSYKNRCLDAEYGYDNKDIAHAYNVFDKILKGEAKVKVVLGEDDLCDECPMRSKICGEGEEYSLKDKVLAKNLGLISGEIYSLDELKEKALNPGIHWRWSRIAAASPEEIKARFEKDSSLETKVAGIVSVLVLAIALILSSNLTGFTIANLTTKGLNIISGVLFIIGLISLFFVLKIRN